MGRLPYRQSISDVPEHHYVGSVVCDDEQQQVGGTFGIVQGAVRVCPHHM